MDLIELGFGSNIVIHCAQHLPRPPSTIAFTDLTLSHLTMLRIFWGALLPLGSHITLFDIVPHLSTAGMRAQQPFIFFLGGW